MSIRVIAALLLLAPAVALAHPGHGPGGLVAGLLHPLLGMDHLLAMLGVGFWAVRHRGMGAASVICGAFLAAVLAGFVVGVGSAPAQVVELGILGSLAVIGALLVGGRRLPMAVGAGLAAAFALFHGHAHGAEMAAGVSTTAFASGFLASTAALLAAGAAAARLVSRSSWLRPAEWSFGGLLVASSIYLLIVV